MAEAGSQDAPDSSTPWRSLLGRAWDIIREPSNKNSQVALAIAVIVISAMAGLLCAVVYGAAARSGGIADRMTGAFVAVLCCIGAFAVGGMLGLLFGSPSWGGSVPRPVADSAGANKSGQDSGTGNDAGQQTGVRPNTSLERIADWLTTMIVGLSLVHLKSIEDRSTTASIWLTGAITGAPHTTNGTAGMMIVLSYGFFGFLLVYLWAMRFLPSELRSSYSELSQQIESTNENVSRLLKQFKTKPLFQVSPSALDAVKRKLVDGGVDDPTASEVVTRYKLSTRADDEPMLDFGPDEQSGYVLDAHVEQSAPNLFNVHLTVTAPAGSTATKLFWLLHNTFAPEVVSECPFHESNAAYDTTVNEAFWVGVVIPVPGQAALRLALDLRKVEGATDVFRGTALPTS
jgi:hypothetical protein